MPSVALCFSIYPSTDFCACQSQQKVFLRAAYLSPHFLLAQLLNMLLLVLSLWRRLTKLLACAPRLSHFFLKSETVKKPHFTHKLIYVVYTFVNSELRITFPSISWAAVSIPGKTMEHVNRTLGSSCQACGVMIYLVKFCLPVYYCHLPSVLN